MLERQIAVYRHKDVEILFGQSQELSVLDRCPAIWGTVRIQ